MTAADQRRATRPDGAVDLSAVIWESGPNGPKVSLASVVIREITAKMTQSHAKRLAVSRNSIVGGVMCVVSVMALSLKRFAQKSCSGR